MTTDIGVRGATLAGPVPESAHATHCHSSMARRTARGQRGARGPAGAGAGCRPRAVSVISDVYSRIINNTTFEHLSNRSICISLVWQRYKTLPCNTILWPWMPLAATSHDLTLMGLA